jgi:hypothetical protein
MVYREGARDKMLRVIEEWGAVWFVQLRYYQTVTGRKGVRSQIRVTDVKCSSDRRRRVKCGWEGCFEICAIGTMWHVVFELNLYLFSFKLITAKKYLKLCTWKILRRPKYKNKNALNDLHINIKNLFYRTQKQEFVLSWARTILFLSTN